MQQLKKRGRPRKKPIFTAQGSVEEITYIIHNTPELLDRSYHQGPHDESPGEYGFVLKSGKLFKFTEQDGKPLWFAMQIKIRELYKG